MAIEDELKLRAGDKCELCTQQAPCNVYEISHAPNSDIDSSIYICSICTNQIDGGQAIDPSHWKTLSDTMWNEAVPVQIAAWRMLDRLKAESWASDLLDMLYLDDENLAWAKAGAITAPSDQNIIHKDSNGAQLATGDTVTLVKDLNVKGASFTAKRGTAVRRISLVQDNPEHIEGKVNGQQIVILTKFVKKSSS